MAGREEASRFRPDDAMRNVYRKTLQGRERRREMGEWTDKAKGRVKETVGAATGDRELEAEGKADTAKGKVKGGIEEVKRGIKDAFGGGPARGNGPKDL